MFLGINRRISQKVLRRCTEGLLQRRCRGLQRCFLFTGSWSQPATHQWTGDASMNTQKPLVLPQSHQSYSQSHPHILQVGISIFWKVLWWIMQMSRAIEITDFLSFSTDSYGRKSVKASQRRPVKDLYKLGFIIASICGGLLFILTLYCLITQKVLMPLVCSFLDNMCPNKDSSHTTIN